MHEVNSSSLKEGLLLTHGCRELGIHTIFVIESCHKQIHIWIIKHLEYGVCYHLIQCPFCFDRFVQTGEVVCQNIEFA